MYLVSTFDTGAVPHLDSQFIHDIDASYQKDAVFCLVDFATRTTHQVIICDSYLARSQRAGKRAGESPSGCRNDVIERGGVGLRPGEIDPVMHCNSTMDTEMDEVRFRRNLRRPMRPPQTSDRHIGHIDRLG